MRLFYEAPGVQLWHGDCREAQSVVGPGRFSLVLADPPYEQTSLAWDVWPDGWLVAMQGLRSEGGSLWCWGTLRTFMSRAGDFAEAKWLLAQDCVWEKHNGSQPAVDRFLRVHEQVAHFYPASAAWGSIYRDPQRVPASPEHAHKAGRVVHRKASPKHTGEHRPSTYVDDGMRRQRSVWRVRSMHAPGSGRGHPQTTRGAGAAHPLLVPTWRFSAGAIRRGRSRGGCSAPVRPRGGGVRLR